MTGGLRSGLFGSLDPVVSVKTTDTFAVNTRQTGDVVNTFLAEATAQQIVDAATVPGGGDMTIAVYDPAGVSEQLAGLTAIQTLTNKTIASHLDKVTYDPGAVGEQVVGITAPQTVTNKTDIESRRYCLLNRGR